MGEIVIAIMRPGRYLAFDKSPLVNYLEAGKEPKYCTPLHAIVKGPGQIPYTADMDWIREHPLREQRLADQEMVRWKLRGL